MTTQLIQKIKSKYPSPVSAYSDAAMKADKCTQYCIGGAFCRYAVDDDKELINRLDEVSRDYLAKEAGLMFFPSDKFLTDIIIAYRPDLDKYQVEEAARKITRLNDAYNFDAAWEVLDHVLTSNGVDDE